MNALIDSNLDLVFNLAKRQVRGTGVDFGEYLTSGYIGLTDAARTFNPELGASFRTHAHRRVRGAMLDQVRQEHGRKDRPKLNTEPIGIRDFVSVDALPDDFAAVLSDGESPRVRMVAAMAADGFQQVEIAKATGYGATTIRNDLDRLKLKLEAR